MHVFLAVVNVYYSECLLLSDNLQLNSGYITGLNKVISKDSEYCLFVLGFTSDSRVFYSYGNLFWGLRPSLTQACFAKAQSVRAFAWHAEDKVLKSQPRQT